MKKVLTTLSIIVALNCSGQDTTYIQHHYKLFIVTKTLVTDSVIYKQHYQVLIKRQKKWFEYAIPHLIDIWNTILVEKTGDYSDRAPRKKQTSK